MASLKQVTNVTRHILVIGTLSIISIIVLMSFINFVKSLHPTPPPPPSVAYGKLPTIQFPTSQFDGTKLTYSLETITGTLPHFSDREPVYKITQPQPTLLALNTMEATMNTAGFSATPTQVTASVYQWVNTDPLPKTVTANIFTGDFDLTSPFLTNQDVIQGNNLPNQTNAVQLTTNFLQNLQIMPQDINTNKTKTTLLSIVHGQLVPATSLSTTQVVRVDYFQNDVDNQPIFYPNATYSTMYLLTAGGTTQPQVVGGHFVHQQILPDHATYPIVSAQQAFDELKKGNAYISSFDNTTQTVIIRNVLLGYYLGDTPQTYLMPIVVFEGDNGFFAYVPAVTSAWVQN